MATRLKLSTEPDVDLSNPQEAARAYDAVGTGYRAYADGEGIQLFDFSGQYGFADREIWKRLDTTLVEMHASGRHAIRIVDAGCGPGTWLIRLVLRARDLGFTAIEAFGFDISSEMIELARASAAALSDDRIGIRFEVGDVMTALHAEEDHSSDLTLCLYGVLNHLPVAALDRVAADLARITDGALFVTVRTAGSLPTIYVAPLHDAYSFHQDNQVHRLEIDLKDGRHIGFDSHLFSAAELECLFQSYIDVEELIGLDVFHGRFALNPHWNPDKIPGEGFETQLERLEHFCASDPAFIDRAAHILLVGNKA